MSEFKSYTMDKIIYTLFGELWDEVMKDSYCHHEECPYKECMYHKYSTKFGYFIDEDIPFYMPRSAEGMKDCMSYMDI